MGLGGGFLGEGSMGTGSVVSRGAYEGEMFEASRLLASLSMVASV